jgi:hypothetical protein
MCYLLYFGVKNKIQIENLSSWFIKYCSEVPTSNPICSLFEEPYVYYVNQCICDLSISSEATNWYGPVLDENQTEDWLHYELEVEKEFVGEYVSEYAQYVREVNSSILDLIKQQPVSLLSCFSDYSESLKKKPQKLPHRIQILNRSENLFRIPVYIIWHCSFRDS